MRNFALLWYQRKGIVWVGVPVLHGFLTSLIMSTR